MIVATILSLSTVSFSPFGGNSIITFLPLFLAVEPLIIMDPTDSSVLAPDPITLRCIARGEPSPDITWVKDVDGSRTVYTESQDNITITTVQSTATSEGNLTISPTGALDTANYSCIAENTFGSAESQQALVTIFGKLMVPLSIIILC